MRSQFVLFYIALRTCHLSTGYLLTLFGLCLV